MTAPEPRVMTARKRGDCAEVAARIVLDDNPDDAFVLAHGYPIGRGPDNGGERYFHAWVETIDGTLVIDRSNGLDVTTARALYYAVGQIDETDVIRYDAIDVRHNIVTTGHWGPWDDDDDEEI